MRGGGNMNNMMKQMQKMQKKMMAAQDELHEMTFESNSWRWHGESHRKRQKRNYRC